jgi:hypothetical protein
LTKPEQRCAQNLGKHSFLRILIWCEERDTHRPCSNICVMARFNRVNGGVRGGLVDYPHRARQHKKSNGFYGHICRNTTQESSVIKPRRLT